MITLAKRYAQAIWASIDSPEQADGLVTELGAFVTHLEGSLALRDALEDPNQAARGAALVAAIAEHAHMQPLARKTLALVQAQNRLPMLRSIVFILARLAEEARGRLCAHVEVATALSASQRERLEAVLSKHFGCPVDAEVRIDERLVAGMVCRIGKVTYDRSLRKQLSEFAEQVGARGPGY